MEVNLSPELQSKLERKAKQEGRNSEALVLEAVERLVDYDAWFVREVEAGLAAADRGQFVDDETVQNIIQRRYPG
jgi:predicted transcriptional regulator